MFSALNNAVIVKECYVVNVDYDLKVEFIVLINSLVNFLLWYR